ncbi:MAG TPA: hypothetical protein VD763_00565 [Candidatus Saccharimonadales bacterium]|nr:hypothetical protein [Candidatus Saccharimonadales bacterium]
MATTAARARSSVVAVIAAAVVIAVGCAPAPAPSAVEAFRTLGPLLPSPSVGASATPSAPTASSAPAPSSTLAPVGRLASEGTVALLSRGSDTLSLIDASGETVFASTAGIASLGFPAWSPDGAHVALTRDVQEGREIVVIDPTLQALAPASHTVVFQSATVVPFYLSWRPDSEAVSFLAQAGEALTLRLAPSDGSAPLDGSGPGSIVRQGNPFYYGWVGSDRLIAHIGTGPEAFLGEIGLDGEGPEGTLGAAGVFRSPAISADGMYEAVVRAGATAADGSTGPGSIVLLERGGEDVGSMPVIGAAAMAFDPSGTTLAAVGATEPTDVVGVTLGPIRLLDPGTDTPRVLLDGSVVSFWWSPDGTMIAAIRVETVDGAPEVRLVFVDVASGDILADPVIQPSQVFIEQVITYFDQYALSHRLWAPDSSSFLIPVLNEDGARVLAMTPEGEVLASMDGLVAFWSP